MNARSATPTPTSTVANPVKAGASLATKRSRAPWSAKLRPEMQPVVMADPRGRGLMLLPTPALVADEISTIPRGALVTVPFSSTSNLEPPSERMPFSPNN